MVTVEVNGTRAIWQSEDLAIYYAVEMSLLGFDVSIDGQPLLEEMTFFELVRSNHANQ